MNWDAIGAIGEIVGAIAVVATLFYLAMQIRHSNRQTQSAARYSFLDAYGKLHASLIENKDAAAVYRRGLSGESLDEDEAVQFLFSLGQWINTWGVMHELYSEGQLPESQWSTVRQDIYEMLSTPGGRKYWDRFGSAWMDPGFFAMVESLLEDDEKTHDILNPV